MTAISMDQAGRGSERALTLTAVALIAILALRLLALWHNGTDLFFDEAQYWSWSEEPSFGYYSKPPLIAWVIAAATSLCGDSEFCIRLPAPIFHTGTAAVLFLIGRRIGGPAVGLWSALAFATLPGVSLSAGIISTDVPLLFFWALALLMLLRLMDGPGWGAAIGLGVAIGIGLNAKYAMAFFVLCLGIYLAVSPSRRSILRDPRLYVALALGGALIAPNLIWNATNSFATFSHTADNARWTGSLVNPLHALEFLGAQLGVFGPILLLGLVHIVLVAWREGLPEAERLLLAFTLPVLAIITVQAFLSRAHANWAATAYVAATVLVTSALMRRGAAGFLKGSLALHLVIAALLGVVMWRAGQLAIPGVGDPLARTLGWRQVADETRKALTEARTAGTPFKAVITDDRAITAELLYYMRGEPTPVMAWLPAGRPQDHYELTRPYRDPGLAPVLLVSVRRDAAPVTERFATVKDLGPRVVRSGRSATRGFHLFSLSGYKGPSEAPARPRSRAKGGQTG